jgi:glycosyltransferase involved in cell wall biosynthesis
MFYINATNVHQGGGQSLLNALLNSLQSEVFLLVDARMPLSEDLASNIHAMRVKPSIVHRFMAEKWLAKNVKHEDVVLCFGNLPPLFRLRGRTIVFLQNRYLIEYVSLKGFSLLVSLRLTIERRWLKMYLSNVDELVVQTQTMKKLLENRINGKVPVRTLPFVAFPHGYTRCFPRQSYQREVIYDFVYVASGEPHKNHLRLIEAWCLLAEERLFPSLCLTLDESRFFSLCKCIENKRLHHGVRVTNLGSLPQPDVLDLYQKSGAVIFPSKFESFGLPLIEARQAGLPVLAPELDYVRDVLDPEQVFDPDSARSIARAVKRFLGIDENPLPLLSGAQFLVSIFCEEIR